MFDILIQGGTVIDGTGAPAFPADIGIRDGYDAALVIFAYNTLALKRYWLTASLLIKTEN